MAEARHGRQTASQGIHSTIAYIFLNATDRQNFTNEQSGNPCNAGPPTADDVGKIACQQDNDTYWFLTDHSPITWIQLSGTASEIGNYITVGATRGLTASGIYLRHHNNVPMNLSPYTLPFNATLFAMGASCSTSSTWTAEVHVGGSLVTGATLSVSAATSAYRDDLNIDFNAGQGVQLYLNGSSILRPTIYAFFKRR